MKSKQVVAAIVNPLFLSIYFSYLNRRIFRRKTIQTLLLMQQNLDTYLYQPRLCSSKPISHEYVCWYQNEVTILTRVSYDLKNKTAVRL